MSEEIRRLQNAYSLENYPYADSNTNRKKLHQLGLMFGKTAPVTQTPPPAEVITLPATPPKVSWVAKNKKLILAIVVVLILYYFAKQRFTHARFRWRLP